MPDISKEIKTKLEFGMLFTSNDISELFGIHKRTVLLWTRHGMPHTTVGFYRQSYRYDIREVLLWTRDHRINYYRRFIDRYGLTTSRLANLTRTIMGG